MFISKKSQITLIIIVGLIIFIAFAFLFSLKKELSPKIDNKEKILYELSSGLVKDQVTSCINKVTSDAIEKIGNNGGFIYDFEGGSIPFNAFKEGVDFLNYTKGAKTYFVQYGLRENSYCGTISYAGSNYPIPEKKFSEFQSNYSSSESCAYTRSSSDYDGVFGEINVPKLCPFNTDSSCQVFAKGAVPGFTIKNQIEDYLSKKLELCVNLSSFENQFNAKVYVEANITSKVEVRDSDVQVSVKYPIKIIFKNAEPISQVLDYQTSVGVRFGKIYSFIYDALSKDARDLSFNLEKQALASSFWSSGIELKKVKDTCLNCEFPTNYDDVVEVFDSKSIVNGKPFLFRLAIQDRRPALDLIADQTYDLATSPSFFEAKIPLNAIDPDDTKITYYFMSEGQSPGWKEDVSPIQINGNLAELVLDLGIQDIGEHKVGILAVDESGFFDFQWFKINVVDSDIIDQSNQDCLDDCDLTGQAQSICQKWCGISANYCGVECQGAFNTASSVCGQCVDVMLNYDTQENHIDCNSILSDLTCSSQVPDCFWVTETEANLPLQSGCYNDRDLERLAKYASISKP